MNTLFDNDESHQEKISLDMLYDRKREIDILRLNTFQKVLHRIHSKIKQASRIKYNDPFIFYIVPEFIIGVPRYDVNHCILYIIDKLEKNGFVVKYTHPNVLFIFWGHYIPSYKRDEIKKKYGIHIDGFGNKVQKESNKLLKNNDSKFKDTSSYKPQGLFKL